MSQNDAASEIVQTRCCIAGGGPAGMIAGFLLAPAGVDVVVLEKHADFLRDFRGDTIHPSTLELMRELGILRDFLQRPIKSFCKSARKLRISRSQSPIFRIFPPGANLSRSCPSGIF
jgi:2-polyprenyl-6-methoxyphenol hydroxylase-like FAD-dependent oxidoreductase